MEKLNILRFLPTILQISSVLLLLCAETFADCGVPPATNTSYSANFYKAQAYFFKRSFRQSANGSLSVPVFEVPIGATAGYDSSTEQSGYSGLTQQQAYSYIQQEYANRGAQIVSECGYRMCNLLSLPNLSDSVRLSALEFQRAVCAGWATPEGVTGSGVLSSASILSVSPNVIPVQFQAAGTAVVRTIQVQNHSPDLQTIRAHVRVDYGSDAESEGSVRLISKSGREVETDGHLSVRIKPGQSVPVSFKVSPPPPGEKYFPRIVVEQARNASLNTRAQVLISEDSSALTLSDGLTVTGQTIAYAPGDDGQVAAGRPFNFVDNGDGTITDSNTGLTWEKKGDDGSLHDVDNKYTGLAGAGSVFEWVQFVNAENGGEGFAGHNDWRVPNLREISTLLDFGVVPAPVHSMFDSDCAVGCSADSCSCTATDSYWSSTTFAPNTALSWFVAFDYGNANADVKTKSFHVRAVRGGM